jgi:hypothetical protein
MQCWGQCRQRQAAAGEKRGGGGGGSDGQRRLARLIREVLISNRILPNKMSFNPRSSQWPGDISFAFQTSFNRDALMLSA